MSVWSELSMSKVTVSIESESRLRSKKISLVICPIFLLKEVSEMLKASHS